MPTRRYSLEPGGDARLEIRRDPFWRTVTLRLDDHELGQLNSEELQTGKEFLLSDGTTLQVRRVSGLLGSELVVLRDGKPLPDTNARKRLRIAAGTLYVVGAVNVANGLLALTHVVPSLSERGEDLYRLVLGVLFVVLAYRVQRRSDKALIGAVVVFLLDTARQILYAPGGVDSTVQGAVDIGLIVIRILLLALILPGFEAIHALGQERPASPDLSSSPEETSRR